MGLFGQIILGLLMIAGGVLLLKYNYQVANNMRISFAEEHLGGGGSYLLWKLLAILLIFAGFTVIFGIWDNLLGWILSPVSNLLGGSEQ